MRSAPSPCTGCPEAKHVLDRLGSERFSLGEGADAGVDGGKEGAQCLEPALDEGTLGPPRPALLGYRPRGLGRGGQHLSQVPPEAALHDLLHHAPEVGGRLVVVLAGARDARAPHEVPFDQAADVHRHVALALLELGGDVFQRDRPGLKIEEREDAALELVQDAGGGSRSAQAVDEDRGRSIHTLHLENSEYSVNTGRRVLAAPVVAQRDLEATFGAIVPKAAVSPCRIGSSAAQRFPIFASRRSASASGTHPLRSERARRRRKRGFRERRNRSRSSSFSSGTKAARGCPCLVNTTVSRRQRST